MFMNLYDNRNFTVLYQYFYYTSLYFQIQENKNIFTILKMYIFQFWPGKMLTKTTINLPRITRLLLSVVKCGVRNRNKISFVLQGGVVIIPILWKVEIESQLDYSVDQVCRLT